MNTWLADVKSGELFYEMLDMAFSGGISFELRHYRFVGQYYARIITEKEVTLEEYF